MHLQVLGCHGGESPEHRTTAFLIDGSIAIDAGALVRGLNVEEQARIDHVFISHIHLDHIQDLAFMADNVLGLRDKPVIVHCTEPTADALEKHFFNDLIWPDFSKIPNPGDAQSRPVVVINRKPSGSITPIGEYEFRTVPVTHPVDCQAMFVKFPGGHFVYSADTGPTEKLWQEINKLSDLKMFIYEVSFPNEMADLALVSGHLTPKMMYEELKKFKPSTDIPVYLYHMKPDCFEVLKHEVEALGDPRLTMLTPLDEFNL
ncbi:MAG: 3',5'-cyclic-nucleotide phosphodiesterase [Myxococcota bacterium]|jgi:3',5'-cyclic-nucleotide phosphodiesterase|nr:3',5'-cyclic-nucleotide phosphodiesterase [Myxococcota bacterium]